MLAKEPPCAGRGKKHRVYGQGNGKDKGQDPEPRKYRNVEGVAAVTRLHVYTLVVLGEKRVGKGDGSADNGKEKTKAILLPFLAPLGEPHPSLVGFG